MNEKIISELTQEEIKQGIKAISQETGLSFETVGLAYVPGDLARTEANLKSILGDVPRVMAKLAETPEQVRKELLAKSSEELKNRNFVTSIGLKNRAFGL